MLSGQNHPVAGYSYQVACCQCPPEINAQWDKPFWNNIPSIQLRNFMGDQPEHFPQTQVKMAYDSLNLYLIFRVDDQYVLANATQTNGRVWEDSCVEFFFSPCENSQSEYFNLETNCIGTLLMQYHNIIEQKDEMVPVVKSKEILIATTLSGPIPVEMVPPVVWVVEYSLPIHILSSYGKTIQPAAGISWRANFYKCADKSSHPHWLTWSKVNYPKPRFHLPEFFGYLVFQ